MKNIWIFNHYATNMFFNEAGRHFDLAKNLFKKGYKIRIFCSNIRHNSFDEEIRMNKKQKYKVIKKNNVEFVFIKTTKYTKNNFKRLFNIYSFYRNLVNLSKKFISVFGAPEIIYASSFHPLTLLAGIKIGKRYNIEVISEIRDLWPESLVSLGKIKRKGFLHRVFLHFEKSIYTITDKLVFTMEGGLLYVKSQGWLDKNMENKIFHVNNGVDLEKFDYNKKNYTVDDADLKDDSKFKIVYAGSIRKFNGVNMVTELASDSRMNDVRFIIYGKGNAVNEIAKSIADLDLTNVLLKGHVEKNNIPYILSKSDLNIIFGRNMSHYKYGQSLNKLFEYFASGKPILSTKKYGFSLISKFNVGIELGENTSTDDIIEAILYFKNLKKEEYMTYCNNARKLANSYDYKNLTNKIIDVIER